MEIGVGNSQMGEGVDGGGGSRMIFVFDLNK